MNMKFLALGAAIGFAIATVPSCGSSSCGPNNCGGCCDSKGTCIARTSVSTTSCGSQGVACVDCSKTSQVCNMTTFACSAGSVDGGTGGGSGGGTGTGGGSGGGTGTGGGSGGGTGTGGGTGGGGGSQPISCNAATQNCPTGQGPCMYVDNMGAGQCFGGGCDLVKQDCNGTERCNYGPTADGGFDRVCGPSGALTEGTACGAGGTDDCAKGLFCFQSKCTKFCYTTNDCPQGTICGGLITVPDHKELPAICVHVTSCDPLTQNCATGEACYPTNQGPLCLTAGTVAVMGTCGGAAGNCSKGALCLLSSPTSTTGTCKQICNLDAGMPACTGTTCTPLNGATGFGACP